MKNVKFIDVVLENCEYIRFDAEQIGAFCCDEITTRISRIACNSISKHQFCKRAILELYSSANTTYNSFGEESKQLVFNRLNMADITAVDVIYEDETTDYILVPWGGDSDYINLYQTSYITKDGNLCILIDEKQTAEEYFHLLE